jgi:tetratricopeptide (TPR) repeat protein
MSDTTAKNIGDVINNPEGPVYITNRFEGEKPQPLPSNIPAAKGFIGREVELTALREAKQNGKTSFVLHGTGGVGKTELALKFIEEIKGEFEAHIKVDMQGLANALSPDDAMLEVIRAFDPNVPSLPSEQIEGLYVSLLNQHKTLLFFDNAKDRDQVEPLNQRMAFVIITSRTTFNVTGGFSEVTEQMSPKDARDLLYSIAGEERFDGKADEFAYIAGYLPMALSPLASILADDVTEDAAALIERYSDRKERLRLADPNRENLSVAASLDLSYERLSDELKVRWRKLAVFPADFDLEALKAFWEDENAKESHAILVKSNLVIFDKKSKRSRLHDLARDYTREKLSDKEFFAAEMLHTAYYGLLFANFNTASLENLAIFDLERTNIETGFALLREKMEFSDELARICDYYTGYLVVNEILLLRLHPREYIKWVEIGLSASRKIGDREGEGSHLGNLGIAYNNLSEYQKAIEYYEQALTILREIGNQKGEGSHLGNLGNAYLNLGEYKKAIEYYEKALAIAREINDRKSESSHLGNLGSVYLQLNEYQKAQEYYEQALTIAEEIGNRQHEGMWLGNLGNTSSHLGEHQKTLKYYEQALAIAREIGDQQAEGVWLGNLGVVHKELGEQEKAVEYYEQALEIARKIGDRLGEGYRLGNLGTAYFNLGERNKAMGLWKEAVRILEEIESPHAEIFRQNLAKFVSE